MNDPTPNPDAHPSNAPGDFYVLNDMCMSCGAPESEAKDLMSHDVVTNHCFFCRQPVSPEEMDGAIMAVVVSCCGAVRYGGRDPEVITRLVKLNGHDVCDHA